MRHPKIPIRSIDIARPERGIHVLVDEVAAGTARLRLERDGTALAAIVSIEDLGRLKRLDEQDREVWDALEAIRAPFRDIPAEELDREAKRAIAEDRAERQHELERATASR